MVDKEQGFLSRGMRNVSAVLRTLAQILLFFALIILFFISLSVFGVQIGSSLSRVYTIGMAFLRTNASAVGWYWRATWTLRLHPTWCPRMFSPLAIILIRGEALGSWPKFSGLIRFVKIGTRSHGSRTIVQNPAPQVVAIGTSRGVHTMFR